MDDSINVAFDFKLYLFAERISHRAAAKTAVNANLYKTTVTEPLLPYHNTQNSYKNKETVSKTRLKHYKTISKVTGLSFQALHRFVYSFGQRRPKRVPVTVEATGANIVKINANSF